MKKRADIKFKPKLFAQKDISVSIDWKDSLQVKLLAFSKEKGSILFNKYQNAFSSSYYEECSAEMAMIDIQHLETLSQTKSISMILYRSKNNDLHLRLFQFEKQIPLANVLPILENMDLRAETESPYQIQLSESVCWINDFTVTYTRTSALEIDKIKDLFQDVFINTLFGLSENDGFNKLVLGAELSWQKIVILRSYAKYLRQTGFLFSQKYIEQALANNANVAMDLTDLFLTKFDPLKTSNKVVKELEDKILQALDHVISLDEDRIIRRIFELIKATLRTNYFQKQSNGSTKENGCAKSNSNAKEYLSFKLSSRDIPELPLPLPLYEIFVYSPRFEGIHLRNSKVARGGIRWSERREDFRTEILDLMKAQIVKNAVIVPSGAKGGFVLKALPLNAPRNMIQTEVVNCYKSFIRGLLDITDNLQNETVIKPSEVVCYDEDDPYLVVAADKGTATFSDTANSIAKEYHFWLGDAFASGGSAGYDHKKMGITAKGAWESVKRHFSELNLNVYENDFTVVGIGDMSGDVFGNGLIYTPRIKLIAAFNNQHIFIDPTPNPETTYQERLRLFNLPSSSWEDFNAELISKGGGVYKRSSKSISISPELKKVLNINADNLIPNELIRAILKAPVDLLWNGGIGTYVKSSTESHENVGDKTNDYCRVNGDELRCRVVAEGGNLGFTQLGRVEYALQGGLINTDSIDNSAGVDCSDHEVNIKILLNTAVNKKTIDENNRNNILINMTQQVADLVLRDNYTQALAISIASFYSKQSISVHQMYIKELETGGYINREVEYLPDDKKMQERKASQLGLTRPELAILLSYTKIYIKNEILKSGIPDHPYLNQILYAAFPDDIQKSFIHELTKHPLHREIVATRYSNQIVNEAGIIFVYSLQNETGATVSEILLAYIVTIHVFGISELNRLIESFDNKISISLQYELFDNLKRFSYLATRWFLHYKPLTENKTQEIIEYFAQSVKSLEGLIPSLMSNATKKYLDSLSIEFSKIGVSTEIAERIVVTSVLYPSLNIIEIATKHGFDLIKSMKIYYAVSDYFNLQWFRDHISEDTSEDYWERLSRLKFRDELDFAQKLITNVIMKSPHESDDPNVIIQNWISQNKRTMQRWEKIQEMLHSSSTVNYPMLFIALRELSDLFQASDAYDASLISPSTSSLIS